MNMLMNKQCEETQQKERFKVLFYCVTSAPKATLRFL